ncbi:MAG: hypothetical protein H6582_10370 [Crocinitomicaceae bacterium]|nr:hypothetical protein [Crocinitomicaceae bacterium]
MKHLTTLLMVGITLSFTNIGYSQKWKEALGGGKSGKVCGDKLSEEDVDQLVYHKRKTDDGIVSEYQKANLNKIVFSDKQLQAAEVNGDNVKTKFSINDPIFFNIILPQSLNNYIIYPMDKNGEFLNDYCYDYSFKKWYAGEGHGAYNTDAGMPVRNIHGSVRIEFFVDGEPYNYPLTLRNVNTSNTTTITSDYIVDDPSKHDPHPDWVDLVQNLSEGEHEVKIVVTARTDAGQDSKSTKLPVAEGSFTLVKKAGETYDPKFDLTWGDYKRGMNDGDLNAAVLKALKSYAAANNYKEEFQAIKVSSTYWTVTVDALTKKPITKHIVVYCKAKWPDGFCKVQKFKFQQDYNGSGYGETYCSGVYWNNYPKAIDCE